MRSVVSDFEVGTRVRLVSLGGRGRNLGIPLYGEGTVVHVVKRGRSFASCAEVSVEWDASFPEGHSANGYAASGHGRFYYGGNRDRDVKLSQALEQIEIVPQNEEPFDETKELLDFLNAIGG